LRIVCDLPSLRRSAPVALIRDLIAFSHTDTFRIVDYCVLGNHIHLLVEADSSSDLSAAMKTFGARLARRLNRHLERTGQLLAERYHARRLKTPREVRNALRYILLNARHHAAERGQRLAPGSIALILFDFGEPERGGHKMSNRTCPSGSSSRSRANRAAPVSTNR
jgi:REP element-mobilizing transposase RayT